VLPGGTWQFYRSLLPVDQLNQTLAPIAPTNQSLFFRAVRD
jgi:hypothetical protein